MAEIWNAWRGVLTVAAFIMFLIAWLILASIEIRSHVSSASRMKRGVRVWAEPLSTDLKHFLQRIPNDTIHEPTGAFLRKQDNAVLVQYFPMKKWYGVRGSLPYVAYIDLRVREPKIQYRAPVSTFLFFFLWMAAAVWGSFQDVRAILFVLWGLLLLCWNHISQRKKILGFIRALM